MKSLQKITSVFLCLTFLVSSLGFTVNKMVCLKSGKTKLSLVHVKDCCPEKKSSTPVIKENCCDLINTSFNLSDSQTSHQLQVVNSYFVQPFYGSPDFSLTANSKSKLALTGITDPPPPYFGRQLLSFISILII